MRPIWAIFIFFVYSHFFYLVTSAVPSHFDFRDEFPSCVPSIVDQGTCAAGSFAYASTYSIAARTCIITDDIPDPSSAEILSCAVPNGCKEGFYSDVVEYVSNFGLRSSSCYLHSATPQDCLTSGCTSTFNFDSNPVVWIRESSYRFSVTNDWLKMELTTNGPISITIPIFESFLDYESGIYSPIHNDSHIGFLYTNLIGYDDTEDYFILTNSKGSSWGESGYFRANQSSEELSFGMAVMAFEVDPEAVPFNMFYVYIVLVVVGLVFVIGVVWFLIKSMKRY
ncbi:hypothetical protein P9112_010054 [Eukaryota sp. TZLM1-RC]